MYVGLDIGSSSSKVAIVNKTKEIVTSATVNLGAGTGALQRLLKETLQESNISPEEVKYTVVTGYGRVNYQEAEKQVTEITCHAKGAFFLIGDARTIIDIGGQDAKAIKLKKDGSVENFVMNEKCAAGTGRFLEVMARVLGCNISELSSLADKSTKTVPISSVCTVFAESEVISRLSSGEKMEDVARGAHIAIAKRVMGMASRVDYQPKIVMTGGVALNTNMVNALSEEFGYEVEVVPHPQAVGAIGAALIAHESYQKMKESKL